MTNCYFSKTSNIHTLYRFSFGDFGGVVTISVLISNFFCFRRMRRLANTAPAWWKYPPPPPCKSEEANANRATTERYWRKNIETFHWPVQIQSLQIRVTYCKLKQLLFQSGLVKACVVSRDLPPYPVSVIFETDSLCLEMLRIFYGIFICLVLYLCIDAIL